MPRLATSLLAAAALIGAALADVPITVGDGGAILRDGKPYRAFGVNYYNAFMRHLRDPANTSFRDGFGELGSLRIPFARFAACGFFPDDMKLYVDNKEEYFARLDAVVKCAEENNVGLVPSLFWYNACLPDLVGEPRNQWGNPESKTIAFMREYTRDVVSRYVASPAIWMWEFGNEYDLAVDLPNAADHRPGVNLKRGTPLARSEADDLRFDMATTAFREFAKAVREIDPHRPITTGNSLPRASSYNQRAESKWIPDTREQFTSQLIDFNPDPCNVLSVHIYPPDHEKRFDQRSTSFDELLALAMDASRNSGKPLFIGEWGARDDQEGPPRDAARRDNFEMITAIDRNNVPLAALWVYDLPDQESFANVTSTNGRKYLLKAIELANHRIAANVDGSRRVDIAGGNWLGSLLDFVYNKGRSGNGFNPLQHTRFRGENLYRDDGTGLYFEHIFNGTAKDAAISMFTPNNDEHSVVRIDAATAVMKHPADASAWGVESEMRYTLNGGAVDMEFRATPTRDQFPLGYCAFMWASYMNHTRDRRIYFYGLNGDTKGWLSFGDDTSATPEGFETGTIACKGVPDLPYEEGAKTLNVLENPTKKFILPFYYGLVDGDGDMTTSDDTMAYVMMFDQRETMRFALWNFIKNASGKQDTHSPAWDWQFVIRNPEVGKTYGYKARVLYIPFTSREDIRAEYERWAGGPGAG
ncbi:MAG: cellulase family glycosylhydrolase [Candidatus Hydrogenedentes bacterium]|nr:cellulase family glycosylhydrolase [Candidatus Hydrogenedentota bacterium]